jgi:hypothetical protein
MSRFGIARTQQDLVQRQAPTQAHQRRNPLGHGRKFLGARQRLKLARRFVKRRIPRKSVLELSDCDDPRTFLNRDKGRFDFARLYVRSPVLVRDALTKNARNELFERDVTHIPRGRIHGHGPRFHTMRERARGRQRRNLLPSRFLRKRLTGRLIDRLPLRVSITRNKKPATVPVFFDFRRPS